MSNETNELIKQFKDEYAFKSIINKIPDFLETISKYLQKEHLTLLKESILKDCPEKNKKTKQDAIEFAEKIWDVCPDILKLKLVSFIYLSKYVNHNVFNFTMVTSSIAYHRYKDKEFDLKIKELLKNDGNKQQH